MTAARLAEIRAWHAENQRAMGRTALRCAAGCDGCVICHTAALLSEVDRIAELRETIAESDDRLVGLAYQIRDIESKP